MTTTELITCDCTDCAEHAARFGKAMPLAVEVPSAWIEAVTAKSTKRLGKSFRHDTVKIGHEHSAISRVMRERTGIVAV